MLVVVFVCDVVVVMWYVVGVAIVSVSVFVGVMVVDDVVIRGAQVVVDRVDIVIAEVDVVYVYGYVYGDADVRGDDNVNMLVMIGNDVCSC